MQTSSRVRVLVVLFAGGLSGCDSSVTGPTTPTAIAQPAPAPAPPPGTSNPAFQVAEVTLSGMVFELTPTGRAPIAGVLVANGEGNWDMTDDNGVYSFGPLWVCPCAAQPWVDAGMTFLWISKGGYTDPPGIPPSVFGSAPSLPGSRDVRIDGDTRFDIELRRK